MLFHGLVPGTAELVLPPMLVAPDNTEILVMLKYHALRFCTLCTPYIYVCVCVLVCNYSDNTAMACCMV